MIFPINPTNLEKIAEELLSIPTPSQTGPKPSTKKADLEPLAYRASGSTDKTLFTYQAGLTNIRSRGYPHFPSPSTIFTILCKHLEGKATAEEDAIAKDMLTSYGEWTNIAWEITSTRRKKTLRTYQEPEGLQWNGSVYDASSMQKSSVSEMELPASTKTETWIDLSTLPSEFVETFYGKPFAQLPERIQKAQVYFQKPNQIWPVGRGSFNVSYNLVAGYDDGAVRGARKKSP